MLGSRLQSSYVGVCSPRSLQILTNVGHLLSYPIRAILVGGQLYCCHLMGFICEPFLCLLAIAIWASFCEMPLQVLAHFLSLPSISVSLTLGVLDVLWVGVLCQMYSCCVFLHPGACLFLSHKPGKVPRDGSSLGDINSTPKSPPGLPKADPHPGNLCACQASRPDRSRSRSAPWRATVNVPLQKCHRRSGTVTVSSRRACVSLEYV